MRSLFSNWRIAKVAILGALLSGGGIALRSNLARADVGGKCCNDEDNESCSGCKSMGLFYISLGQNTVYHCKDYVNPILCEEYDQVCWSATGAVNVFSDENCTVVIGSMTNPKVSMQSCTYDSCD